MLSVVLSASQYALYQSFMQQDPETIADALTDVHYRLDESTARAVAHTAWRERRAWDQWVDFDLGTSAVDAEFDLQARTVPTCSRPIEPDRKATAREAFRVACRARKTLRIEHPDLVVLVVGAFLLDLDVAYDVADAAFAGRELPAVNA